MNVTVQLRNPRTIGVCGAPDCGDRDARLFACGWRCPAHAPIPHTRKAAA